MNVDPEPELDGSVLGPVLAGMDMVASVPGDRMSMRDHLSARCSYVLHAIQKPGSGECKMYLQKYGRSTQTPELSLTHDVSSRRK